MSEENNKHSFGLIEMIGSIILQLIDPDRTNNKKYLDHKYYKANRITGIIILATISIIIVYLVLKYAL